MKTRRTGPILVAIATIFSLSAVVAPAGAAQAKDSDDALVAAGGTLTQENLTAGQDQDGFTAQADTTTTTLPQQPSSGIVLDGKDPTAPGTAIGLPYADAAGEAQPSDLGGITYDNNNDSTTTALPKSDGSLQIATTITSAQAPSDYTYTVTGSEGSHPSWKTTAWSPCSARTGIGKEARRPLGPRTPTAIPWRLPTAWMAAP